MRRLIISLLFIWPQACHADITKGLLAWWKFEEGTGTSASDSSGNGRTGTLVNAPSWVPGMRGGGLQFDQTDKYINAGSSIPLDSNNWTIALWSYPTTFASLQRLIGYYGDGPTLWTGGGSGMSVVHSGTIDFNCSMTNVLNTWQHIAATRSGSTITCYRNGVQTAQSTSFANNFTADNSVYIGKSATYPTEYYAGILDDVRLYNRALTASEVMTLFVGGSKIANGTFNHLEIKN